MTYAQNQFKLKVFTDISCELSLKGGQRYDIEDVIFIGQTY